MKRLVFSLSAASALLTAGTASAAGLDFTAYPNGAMGSTVLVMPGATITGYGSDLYNLSAFYLGGSGGSICSLSGSNCQADLQISFSSAVSNLTFQTVGYDPGDSVLISAYNSSNVLLGQANVTADQLVDFSGYSGIARLYFDDSSSGAGYGYGAFNFNVSAVPEPETYAMLLAGLGVLGFMGKRRRAG